ncbi:hypothetical protein YC2023_109144 [Brassica napus]
MLLKSEPYLTRGRAVKDDAVKSVGQRTKEQGLDNLVCLKQSWWSGVWNRCDRAVYVWGHNVQSRLRNGASNEATETMRLNELGHIIIEDSKSISRWCGVSCS